jgi:hypothetical protein
VGDLLKVEVGSDSHRVQTVRPAQRGSGDAAVVDGGWVRRERETIGVVATAIVNPGQLRAFENRRSRHDRVVPLIRVMFTALENLHSCFSPSTPAIDGRRCNN